MPNTLTAKGKSNRYFKGMAINNKIKNDKPSPAEISLNCLITFCSDCMFKYKKKAPFGAFKLLFLNNESFTRIFSYHF